MHYNFYDIYKGDTGLIVRTHWVQQIVGVENEYLNGIFLASSVYYFTSRCYGQRCVAFPYSVKHNLLCLEFPVTKNKICQKSFHLGIIMKFIHIFFCLVTGQRKKFSCENKRGNSHGAHDSLPTGSHNFTSPFVLECLLKSERRLFWFEC